MAECTCEIVLAPEPEIRARKLWNHTTVRTHVHAPLRDLLAEMAAGRERCMYCGDNQGTDIDHFEPIDRHPMRAFDWTNHVLACSLCNSHLKRAAFPLDEGGRPLLIDPTAEDPTPHLRLVLAAGIYHPLTPRGQATIDLFDLNRGLLAKGRVNAFHVTKACVAQWAHATAQGDHDAAAHWATVVNEQPIADVVQAMLHQALDPAAEILFEDDPQLLAHLREPRLRSALLIA
ncbi:HNH endonuclease [Kitasatospora cathayae]|uniref:HNH endonuclease n=1 Tax=Kitasatospora cathayae TaxID=3004092 RepID=A0ABY7QH40_9ACTN|nr:HNH endonuclease [Kitasatospora sp. HUAS 3-15]WBP92144.1 HNH endonuclease [Kitasatospora sp. HUAS 3-15]